MQNNPLARRKLGEIEAAIDRAKAYAADRGVPLTAERLAAELDMDLELLHRVARGEEGALGPKTAAIRRACGEATASVMEHAMQRGSSPNMHMLYLKNNAGYDLNKAGKASKPTALPTDSTPVVFVGEEYIED